MYISTKGVLKSWKKRFFRLFGEDKRLCFYASDTDVDELGFTTLNSSLKIELFPKKPLLFQIANAQTGTLIWMLRADNKEDFDTWMQHYRGGVFEVCWLCIVGFFFF